MNNVKTFNAEEIKKVILEYNDGDVVGRIYFNDGEVIDFKPI